MKPLQLLEAPGLHTVLRSDDFGAWESLVAGTLGHHRSRLLPGSPPFQTHIRTAAVAEFKVVLLHGRSGWNCCASRAATGCSGCRSRG